jgi:hypothetical protein
VCALLGALSACGGGGDGGSANPPPPVDLSPEQIYTGRRTPIEIAAGNHADAADAAWFGPMLAFVLAQDVITDELPEGPLDETITGNGGGSARIRGTIANGTGSLTIEYNDFTEDGTSFQGSETLTILVRRTLQAGSVRRNFHALRVRADDLQVTIDGSLTRTDSTVGNFVSSQWDISGDVVLTQSASSQVRVASLSLRRTLERFGPFNVFPTLQGTAKVFESTLGSVDVSIDMPIRFAAQEPQTDAFAGSLLAIGAGDSRLWVSPLSTGHVAVELGPSGASKPTRSIVYRWDDAFERAAGASRSSPQTISTVRSDLLEARVGSPVPLESRFSEGANGEFVTSQWSLVLSPPGSQAVLSDELTTRAALLPDVEGNYLLRLQTSDSTGSGSDYVAVYARVPNGSDPIFGPVLHRVLPPYMKVAANSLVQLDGSRSYMNDASAVQSPTWTLFPSTQTTPLTTNGFTTEFTTQADQDYLAAFMRTGDLAGPVGARNEIWIATTGNVSFAQPVGFDTENAPAGTTPFTLADIDSNGTVDLLERTDFATGGTARLRVLLNKGAGRFDWHPVTFDGGAMSPVDVSALPVDLNADGKLDIVVPGLTAMGVFTQTQANPLSFVYRQLPRAVDCGGFAAGKPISFTVLDVDRDGRKDIVSESACGLGPLEFYRNDPLSADGFAPAVEIAAPAGSGALFRIAAGDVDGDGHDDLLGVDNLDGTTHLVVWRNLPNAQFEVLSTTAMTGNQVSARVPIWIVDLNADGDQDVVFNGNAGIVVGFGDGSGSFTFSAPLPGLVAGSSFGEHVMFVDLDHDGRLDIANQISWARQLPGNQFARGRRYASSIGPAQIADMNGDGRPDLVSYNGPRISFAIE